MRSVQACLEYFPASSVELNQVATLQIGGENDPFFPPDQQLWAHRRMQSPQKKLVIFRNAGHYPLYPAFENVPYASSAAIVEAAQWFNAHLTKGYDKRSP